jgi:subtilisin family serine protease
MVTLAGVLNGASGAATAAPGSKDDRPTVAVVSPTATTGRWLTLVTGDRVLVTGRPATGMPTVRPGPGRASMTFHQYTEAGETYVIPQDAEPLVARGLVDRRLFDVTGLVRAGYDDRNRSDVPLIVSGKGTSGTALTAMRARVSTAKVTHELPSVAGLAVRQDKKTAVSFWGAIKGGSGPEPRLVQGLASDVTKVWLDAPVRATLDKSVPQIGAPAAWAAGHTGKGATVAVLDSGIDETHPDLADAVVGAQDFTRSDDGVKDGFGHGTHVASIITGGSLTSGGKYIGVAPDAKLLVGKVLNDFGLGFSSDVIAGMEWAAAQGVPVVNMSLSSSVGDESPDPETEAVNRLTAETGTLFVVSAGNKGPDTQTVSSPGIAEAALTVGAVDGSDHLADFSNLGPTRRTLAVKPDITAPGVGIVAARAAGTSLGAPVDDKYTALSGTSMAAPHVAGAAAILAAEHPDWKAGQLKAILMGSAKPSDGLNVYQQGAGRVDVARADGQPLYTTPATINDGLASWPHADDQPIRTPVTYHNDGTTPVTVHLALDVKDPTGAAAVDGMFTPSDTDVTVPAGGDTKVTVTTDTTKGGPDGLYGGVLTATGDDGSITVRTPIGITKEVESYDVTMNPIERDGTPAPDADWGVVFANTDQKQFYLSTGRSIRLPKGTYFYEGTVRHSDDGIRYIDTEFIEPAFEVTGDSTVTLDAREGKPVGLTVDRPEARPGDVDISAQVMTPQGPFGNDSFGGSFDEFFLRPSDTSAPAGQFTFGVSALMARPDPSGEPSGDDGGGFVGPYLYHVNWSQDRQVPEQLVRHVADRTLAIVHTVNAATSAGSTGIRDFMVKMPLPGTLTDYYTPSIPWDTVFSENSSTEQREFRQMFPKAGHYEGRWNSAVFGPAGPTANPSTPLLQRQGDTLLVQIPYFSDQTNNRPGASIADAQNATLYRDGQKIAESPFADFNEFTVPDGKANYRLETSATRSVADLSTKAAAAYTFSSELAGGDGPEALPVFGIRFAPGLDDRNQAPAGHKFTFPVHLTRQAGAAPYGTVNAFTVDVSYDDGKTWQPARLTGNGDDRTVSVTHPKDAGYVSLRAKATDTAGNGIEETITRAYAITAY